MPIINHADLRTLQRALYSAAGFPEDQAHIVADHLVDANLYGHDSHGVIRTPGYIRSIRSGGIKPVGELKIVRETPVSAVIDAERTIGIVVAHKAMQMATDRALEHTIGAVAVHQSSHIGRLGDYPPKAAERNCIGLLMLNGGGRFTAPFGGTGRRLPPNPIAFSAPTPNGPPLMLDMTTSMSAGGKVDVYRARGQQTPDGWLVDEEGNKVTDPARFKSGEVAMLPLGGPQGHKGYGLGMMIDAIAGGLSWAGCSAQQPTRGGTLAHHTAIKHNEIGILSDWIKSSPKQPGVDKIYLPGEIEHDTRTKREAEGIFMEDETWNNTVKTANDLSVSIPETK